MYAYPPSSRSSGRRESGSRSAAVAATSTAMHAAVRARELTLRGRRRLPAPDACRSSRGARSPARVELPEPAAEARDVAVVLDEQRALPVELVVPDLEVEAVVSDVVLPERLDLLLGGGIRRPNVVGV